MKVALINLRLALVAIATDLSEHALRWHTARLERLAKREIALRIQYCAARPLRRSVIMPE